MFEGTLVKDSVRFQLPRTQYPVFGLPDLSKWALFSPTGKTCYHAKADHDELLHIEEVAAEWGERGVGEMCDVLIALAPIDPGKAANEEVKKLGLAGPVAQSYWRKRVEELKKKPQPPEKIWVRCVYFFDGMSESFLPLPMPRKLTAFEDAVKAALSGK